MQNVALKTLHSHKIIHRDLKSMNVLIFKNSRNEFLFKLGDMNVASILSDPNRTSKLKGTLLYLPPEFFSEQRQSYESDFWALGCMYFLKKAVMKWPCWRILLNLRIRTFFIRNTIKLKIQNGSFDPIDQRYS